MRPFDPFFRNPHLATIAGNFWTRPESEKRWPTEALRYQTEPQVEVLVHSQHPDGPPRGELLQHAQAHHGLPVDDMALHGGPSGPHRAATVAPGNLPTRCSPSSHPPTYTSTNMNGLPMVEDGLRSRRMETAMPTGGLRAFI